MLWEKKEYGNHAIAHQTLKVQIPLWYRFFSALFFFFGEIAHPVLYKEIKNLHNSTEKNKKNMKGWDYSQPREHEYLQTGSTARK